MDPQPDQDTLNDIAGRVSYEGSSEHKNHPSFAGPPGLRRRPSDDATPCDARFAQQKDLLTEWLKEAIKAGQISAYWENGFPRYAWIRKDETVYEARLVNSGQGGYKGYALKPHEYPREWL